MASKKTTLQDIADSSGYSRVTVAKALNNMPGVSQKTRAIILSRAQELNYKEYRLPASAADSSRQLSSEEEVLGNVALLANIIPDSFHMASYLMTSLEQALGEKKYSLSLHTIAEKNLHAHTLPASLNLQNVDAIICLETFSRDYCNYICSLGKPVLFCDIYSSFEQGDLPADLLLTDNYTSSRKLYSSIIRDSRPKSIGFLGDPRHCYSFQQRYRGFLSVAEQYDFRDYREYSITDEDPFFSDRTWLYNRLSSIKLPDLLVCANDILAMRTFTCLDRMEIKVPDDLLICGYDGTPVISSLYPDLTTIISPSKEMGVVAAEMLTGRIKNPGLPHMVVTVNSEPLFSRSTQPNCQKEI